MIGLLNLHKPAGPTSRDVVNRVQRMVWPGKVGHAGTLDPLASGVLVVCVGPATRLIRYVQQMPKSYRGTFLLGRTSPSDDTEIEPTVHAGVPQPSRQAIEATLPRFTGAIDQRPPAYSAIKVAGQKAYDMARRGEKVELPSRRVEVYSLSVAEYDYPRLVLDIRCGSGTYVRSLGRDLAQSLGTGAVMSELVRTSIGPFTLETATQPGELTSEALASNLLPPAMAVAGLPSVTLDDEQRVEVVHGRTIACAPPPGASEVAAFVAGGQLLAILGPRGTGNWGPKLVLPTD
jgi:tRNA pseudouridine55 synthase